MCFLDLYWHFYLEKTSTGPPLIRNNKICIIHLCKFWKTPLQTLHIASSNKLVGLMKICKKPAKHYWSTYFVHLPAPHQNENFQCKIEGATEKFRRGSQTDLDLSIMIQKGKKILLDMPFYQSERNFSLFKGTVS